MELHLSITRGHTIALFKVITLGLLLGFGIQFLFAWTAPTATAPAGNVAGPLTVGAINQIKTGGLSLGSLIVNGGANIGVAAGADNLCLNGSCITAWPTGGDNFGNHAATMNINMAGRQVTNLGATTNPNDAATKAYVDRKGFSSCHQLQYQHASPPYNVWVRSNYSGLNSAVLCPVGELAVAATCYNPGNPHEPFAEICPTFNGGNVTGRSGADYVPGPSLHSRIVLTCCSL